MNTLTVQQNDNSIVEQAQVDFDEVASRFLSTRKTDNTRQVYSRALSFYRQHSQELGIHPLKADGLIAYSNSLNAREDITNDTKRSRLKAVQSFFSWLYTFGLSPVKPEMVSELISIPPARQLSPRDILTSDEAKRLLSVATSQQDRCLIRLMLDCGLRVSEALNVKVDDTYSANDRYYVFVSRAKGNKQRDVEMPESLFNELREYKSSGKLFYIHRATAFRIIRKLSDLAGIEKDVSPHSLRHTHAHHLRLLGWPIEAISQRLGHASIETTKLYTRPAEIAKSISLPKMEWN